MRLISPISSPAVLVCVKPIVFFDSPSAPALVVMITHTLRKSALRPLLSVSVPVVHHLQEDVEDVRVRLLDLVEQQHGVRVLGDGLGEEARPGRSPRSPEARR
jgi:hypothetical protein